MSGFVRPHSHIAGTGAIRSRMHASTLLSLYNLDLDGQRYFAAAGRRHMSAQQQSALGGRLDTGRNLRVTSVQSAGGGSRSPPS
jgi:hypothetical protein